MGDLEPVKDETVLYFARMKKVDVPVSLRVYHGCFHSFETTAVNSNVALNAQRYLLDSFRYAQKKYFAHNEEPEQDPEDEQPQIPQTVSAEEEETPSPDEEHGESEAEKQN